MIKTWTKFDLSAWIYVRERFYDGGLALFGGDLVSAVDGDCLIWMFLICDNLQNPMWTTMRHELAPIFTSSRLRGITELMNINSEELVRRIQKDHIDNNKPVDMKVIF